MSVVLQTFLANPFLRAYFLADRHNRYACARTLVGEACLSCELDLLFSEVSPPFYFPPLESATCGGLYQCS